MESIPLYIGIAAAVLVGFWLVKKLIKFAIFAGIAGLAAWFWYFQIN